MYIQQPLLCPRLQNSTVTLQSLQVLLCAYFNAGKKEVFQERSVQVTILYLYCCKHATSVTVYSVLNAVRT